MASNSSSLSRTGFLEKYRASVSQRFWDKWILFFFFRFHDAKQRKKEPETPFGIRLYVGLPGTGKTVSMVEYLMRLRAAYPGIKIYTNFGFRFQDGDIQSIDDFASINDPHGVVFAVDELQLSFQARQYNSFPTEMIFVLTQNRKFKKHFVCTAQLFEHTDKIFRDLTNTVVQCKNWGNRWFFQKAYTTLDYKTKYNPDSEKLPFVSWRYSFVATDFIFNAYDTYKVVEAFKKERSFDQSNASATLARAMQRPVVTDAERVREDPPAAVSDASMPGIRRFRII